MSDRELRIAYRAIISGFGLPVFSNDDLDTLIAALERERLRRPVAEVFDEMAVVIGQGGAQILERYLHARDTGSEFPVLTFRVSSTWTGAPMKLHILDKAQVLSYGDAEDDVYFHPFCEDEGRVMRPEEAAEALSLAVEFATKDNEPWTRAKIGRLTGLCSRCVTYWKESM